MSIASKKQPIQRAATAAPKPTPAEPSTPRRKRRGLTVAGIVLVVLSALVALLPTILVHTSLLGSLVRRAANLDGSVTFQSASLGWLTPVSFTGIEIRDAQNEPVLAADSLSCDRTLLKLVFKPSNVGTLRIEKPRLSVKTTRDGSNVEALLSHWLSSTGGTSGNSSSKGVDLSLEIVDGDAAVVDLPTQQSWHVTGMQFAIDLSRRLPWPTRVEGTATIDAGGRTAALVLKSHLKASDTPPSDPAAWSGLAGTEGDLSLQATALPLAMFQRIAAHYAPGLAMDGTLDANIDSQWTGPANIKLSGAATGGNVTVAAPLLGSDALHMDKIQATCQATRQGKQLTIDSLVCQCDFLQVRASGTPDRLQLVYQGDLARLQPWIASATGGLRLAGRLSGNAQLQPGDGQFVCTAQSDVEQLTVVAPSGQSFQDPRVHCAVQCSYQTAGGVLKIDQCELTSAVAGAKAAAQVAFHEPGELQLNGQVDYQWEKLNQLLRPYCGTAVQFAGGGASSIAYRGPLAIAQGQADTSIQFGGARVYDFQLGPGQLKLHLANGVLQAEPFAVSCNQGTVTVQPELRIAAQPMEFRLSGGTLANHVQLDQTACASALRYVVPVLASATKSQGQFSVQLDGCRIPLGDLAHAEIAGRVIVHSATMTPGPMVQQLTTLLADTPSLVSIQPESVILFRMTGGRIYHQGLVLQFPTMTMRTYGSVGLDDTLKLMVETSIPLKWLPSNAVTDAIRNQKMQIPIGGTLKSPQLDVGELARVKSQVIGNLARGVLQSDLGNQLKGLIQPGR